MRGGLSVGLRVVLKEAEADCQPPRSAVVEGQQWPGVGATPGRKRHNYLRVRHGYGRSRREGAGEVVQHAAPMAGRVRQPRSGHQRALSVRPAGAPVRPSGSAQARHRPALSQHTLRRVPRGFPHSKWGGYSHLTFVSSPAQHRLCELSRRREGCLQAQQAPTLHTGAMEVAHLYTKKRRDFGHHAVFEDVPARVLESIPSR